MLKPCNIFADLRWKGLISIISKLSNHNLSEEEVQNLLYQERCKLLNINAVLVVQHFQFHEKIFFKEILVDDLVGKIKYYVIRVGFQVRGSPNIQAVLFLQDFQTQLKIQNFNLQKCTSYRDTWKHSNKACRFNFGRYSTEKKQLLQNQTKSIYNGWKK